MLHNVTQNGTFLETSMDREIVISFLKEILNCLVFSSKLIWENGIVIFVLMEILIFSSELIWENGIVIFFLMEILIFSLELIWENEIVISFLMSLEIGNVNSLVGV